MNPQTTLLKLSAGSVSNILKCSHNSGTATKTSSSSSSSGPFRMPNYEEIVLPPMPIKKTLELCTGNIETL